jgi:hypothetical protein
MEEGAMTTHRVQQLPSISLYELAFACYIYKRMSNADEAYEEFRKATKPRPDLGKAEHRTALVIWLRKWGCRQFAKDDHKLASNEIRDWYEECYDQLRPLNKKLLEFSDVDFASASTAYAKLAERTASWRSNKTGGESNIKVGPTGAAKILFAIRPQALIPWDAPIREAFEPDDSAKSYADYLMKVKIMLEELGETCKKNGYGLSDLPELVGRPSDSSLVKLIDEYFWVTITNKCKAPSNQILEQWTAWTHGI